MASFLKMKKMYWKSLLKSTSQVFNELKLTKNRIAGRRKGKKPTEISPQKVVIIKKVKRMYERAFGVTWGLEPKMITWL